MRATGVMDCDALDASFRGQRLAHAMHAAQRLIDPRPAWLPIRAFPRIHPGCAPQIAW
ncbi:hypothetical protein LJR143_003977 [Pseudoxanthomonas sp. LjRoot143]|uniref:hypothetical protein n=1 Tax=Pseudoxanthomonas sp. LjRoot143 TaxID=3342266 RepID=UPI003ECD3B93